MERKSYEIKKKNESHGPGAAHGAAGTQKLIFGLCDPAASGDPDDDPADF